MVRFSIVMPAHRPDELLLQALASAERAMQHHAAELIVVANGAHRDAVAAMVERHRRCAATKVLVSELASLAYCLNRGIEQARGEYVARLDADDCCEPTRFDAQLRAAESTAADFVFGAAQVIDAHGCPTGEVRPSSSSLWNRCGPVHPTAFMRRSALLALGGYGQRDCSEDYELWLRAQQAGCRFHAAADVVIRYRTHAGQQTAAHRLAQVFAADAGTKLTLALRHGSPGLLLGALLDTARHLYRRCADTFSS